MFGRFVTNLLIGLLTLWAIYSLVSNFVGVTVYFPFNLAVEQDIPYHRWQSVRLALLRLLRSTASCTCCMEAARSIPSIF